VWLAQSRDPALDAEAEAVAAQFGLPLTVIDTGLSRLERELEHLLAGVAPGTPSSCAQTAVAPVPPNDQPRPRAQTAALTTVSAHATQPPAPGHSAAPRVRGETAALTTVSAHATQPPAPGHSAAPGMGAETAAIDHESGAGPGSEVTGPGPGMSLVEVTGPRPEMTRPGMSLAGAAGAGPEMTRPGMSLAEVTGPGPEMTRPGPGMTGPGPEVARPGTSLGAGAGAAGAGAAKGTGRCAGGC